MKTTMNKELDDLTWLQLNFQNRMVERTLKICGMTLNDIIKKYNKFDTCDKYKKG